MPRKYSLFFISAAALTLSACATPETRVRTALTRAGLSKPVAGCMAERMVDRLSLWQLNKLSKLGKLKEKKIQSMTMEEFVKRTKALQDPEILAVVSSSAVACALSK